MNAKLCLPNRISGRMRTRTAALRRIEFRFGCLRRLPKEYRGERPVIVAKRLRNRGRPGVIRISGGAGAESERVGTRAYRMAQYYFRVTVPSP